MTSVMPFSGEKLQDTARETARALAGVSQGRPFTEKLDKQHWVSVGAGRGITADLVAELVDDSYHLVLRSA
ncbi:hypothetical protein WEI85_05125 [Actinomycetes bacterium KLBMP 9797]